MYASREAERSIKSRFSIMEVSFLIVSNIDLESINISTGIGLLRMLAISTDKVIEEQ